MKKTCTICGIEKGIEEFPKNKNVKSGYDARCKECRNEYNKKYREDPENKKRLNEYSKNYREENKEKVRTKQKEYLKTEKGKEIRKKALDKYNKSEKRKRDWTRFNNSQKRRDYANKWIKEKARKDLSFRIKRSISASLKKYLRENKKDKTLSYLSYTIEELVEHLKNQFDEKMSWDNYGSYWEIDHIIPQSIYDFTKEENIKKCWDLRNLRPLEKIENIKKNDSFIAKS
jgi:hypothetical protein